MSTIVWGWGSTLSKFVNGSTPEFALSLSMWSCSLVRAAKAVIGIPTTCSVDCRLHCACVCYVRPRHHRQHFLRACRCRAGRVRLPLLVLVRVGVVANASDHKTWEAVHQAR